MNSAHIDLLLRLTGLFGTLWAGLLLLKVSRKGPSSRNQAGLISGWDLRIASWLRLIARGLAFVIGLSVVSISAWSIRDLSMSGDGAVTVSVPPGRSANASVGTGTPPDGSSHGASTGIGEGAGQNAAAP